MDLAPYTGTVCRMCRCLAATYEFCVRDCLADADGSFERVPPAMGAEPDRFTPHLHRKCERCGFEWLEETAPP